MRCKKITLKVSYSLKQIFRKINIIFKWYVSAPQVSARCVVQFYSTFKSNVTFKNGLAYILV